MNIFRKILHCNKDGSDKVYIVEVNKVTDQFVVLVSWGRRTAPRLSNQIKCEVVRELEALRQAEKLVSAKQHGKDKYVLAKPSLDINGFKIKEGNKTVMEAVAGSKVQSNVTFDVISTGRRIRI